MDSGRRVEFLARLGAGSGEAGLTAARLCVFCTEVTAVSGAGISLMDGDVSHGAVCTTDEVSTRVEELQFALGEGPCVDAFREELAVAEPDLAAPGTVRWSGFSPAALSAGVRAIFGFPLRVGATRVGALDLYRDQPGPLSQEEHADALVLADLAAETLLMMQVGAAPGELGVGLDESAEFRSVVHQAAGMVSVQLDVSVEVALIRVRAYAFGHDRPLVEVATGIIGRTLRLD